MTFMDDLRAGKVSPEDVNVYIDEWHWTPEDGLPLHSYLGMTYNQYAAWVQDPDSLTGAYGTDPSD